MSYIIGFIVALLFVAGYGYVALTEAPQGKELPLTNSVTPAEGTSAYAGAGAVLDLSNSGLGKVPAYVFSRTEIIKLDLSGNNLEGALQAEVRHLRNLTELDLSNNDFTGVPAEVGQLSKLRILNLANNKLTGLPYELGNLSNLERLDLSGNAVSEADLSIITSKLPPSTVIVR